MNSSTNVFGDSRRVALSPKIEALVYEGFKTRDL